MHLRIELLSDSAFGRGDGVAGMVDQEVEHDALTGLPIIKGRTIKGLMIESCADVLYALKVSGTPGYEPMESVAATLFGVPGSDLHSTGLLHFGTATLPPDLVLRVKQSNYRPTEVLEAMTDIRRQTAVDYATDTPKDGTLRSTRVVLRETIFYAPIKPETLENDAQYAMVAACAAGLRHAGLNRTRGLGHVAVTLEDAPRTHADYLQAFTQMVKDAR